MTDNKQTIIERLIDREGGFVDDPADSGGATNHGITERLARREGYDGNMRGMPRSIAVDIYTTAYWKALRLDDVLFVAGPRIAEELLDTGVNQGIARAADFLQRALNVLNDSGALYPDIKNDRSIGPVTIDALSSYIGTRVVNGELVLLRMLNTLQGAFYIDLAERRQKDERFIFGWFLNRVGEL
jgi:lysozyme family protein